MKTQTLTKARKLAVGAVVVNLAVLLTGALALPEPARTILPVLALMLPLISATVVESAAGLSDPSATA